MNRKKKAALAQLLGGLEHRRKEGGDALPARLGERGTQQAFHRLELRYLLHASWGQGIGDDQQVEVGIRTQGAARDRAVDGEAHQPVSIDRFASGRECGDDSFKGFAVPGHGGSLSELYVTLRRKGAPASPLFKPAPVGRGEPAGARLALAAFR